MQKLILKLAGILGKVAAVFLFGIVVFHAGRVYQEQYPTRDALDLLPSIQDIQHRIGAKVDGKLCEGWGQEDHSETQTLWDKQYCQQAYDWAVANMPRKEKK